MPALCEPCLISMTLDPRREDRAESSIFGQLVRDLEESGFGFRFQARGRSMLPTIRDGEILQVERVDPATLRVGDIVLFRSGGEFKAHRVIRNRKECFLTRGDASSTPGISENGTRRARDELRSLGPICRETARLISDEKYFSRATVPCRTALRPVFAHSIATILPTISPPEIDSGSNPASPRVKKNSLRLRMTLCALNSPSDLKSTISPTLKVAGSTRSTCRKSPSRIVGSILRPPA